VVLIAVAIAVAWPLVEGRRQSGAITRFALTFRPGQSGGQFDLSPDGRTLVYRSVGSDGIFRLYRRAMDQFDATVIPDTEDGSYPFFSPDGQWIGFTVGRTLKKVSLAGGTSVTLAMLSDFPRGASWGESGDIVVGASRSGLLQVSENGGDPTVLVSPAGRRHWYPQILSRHRLVLFTETRFDESVPTAGDAELQVLELDTRQRRTLLHGSAGRFVTTRHIVFLRGNTVWAVGFDPDRRELTGTPVPIIEGIADRPFAQVAVSGGSLAYVPGGTAATRRLVWVDRRGREESIAAPPRGYTYPRLSPDGTRAAIDVREAEIDIFIYDFSRQILTPLTFDPAQDEYPVWAPDGRRVFFASFRDQQWGVFSQAADGTGNTQRIGAGPSELDPMSISPDGHTLVVSRAGDLMLLSSDQSGSISTLVSGTSVEHNAELSPDGRWIAYQSNESGRHEIYVRPFPRVSDGRWQISNSGGTHPAWARNGRELFYIAPAGLVSVPVRSGRTFEFGNASVVLKGASERYWVATVGRAYDVAPDGQRFLMLKEEEPSAARIHVVQNWFEELTRLVTVN
jgi:serine/threonine-protein kinase